jgi:hypothetical protein
MKKLTGAVLAVLLTATAARAQEESVEQLKKKVADLEKRLAALQELVDSFQEIRPELERQLHLKRLTGCQNNLLQLWKMQHNYMVQFGGRTKSMPREAGGAFWLKLSQTTPPLIEPELMQSIYACPEVKGIKIGTTTYRGPVADVNTLKEADFVGCCGPGHHPDGAIVALKKSSEIVILKPADKEYKAALEGTVDDPEEEARRKSCRGLVENLRLALRNFEADNGADPPSGNANLVKALATPGPKKLPYFEFAKGMLNAEGEVLDPWGRPFVYRVIAGGGVGSVDLYSTGPDGKDDRGTGDDIK